MRKRILPALLALLLLLALPGCAGGGKTAVPASAPTPEVTFAPEDVTYSQEQGMELDPETKLDKYNTEPAPEGKPLPVEPDNAEVTDEERRCTISISCAAIPDNLDKCDKNKRELVPEDGWILEPMEVVFFDGESVFQALKRTCRQQGIHMEFANTPIYNSACIEGINDLCEFDVGELSGWMYSVNGWFPNHGCSRCALKDGDAVEWVYTCDLGLEVGGCCAVGG